MTVTSPLLVTGGTGTLGRLVVQRLRSAGHPVRVFTRHGHEPLDGVEFRTGDLDTGAGIEPALEGIGTIVNCAGSAKGDEDKARTLVRAASKAGVQHLVNISVVGADRVPVVSGIDRSMFGYFAAKRGAEEVIAESGVPWTTLRATQFHDLVLTTVQQLAKLPVMPAPAGMRCQPVDAGEVADRLVELALGSASGLVPELGGPRVYEFTELARGYLQASHRRRLLLPLPIPGKAARAVRAGAILTPEPVVGQRTWEDFLAERVSQNGRV
jgi:uncharacterized protein YbjT (DUF2867 family)